MAYVLSVTVYVFDCQEYQVCFCTGSRSLGSIPVTSYCTPFSRLVASKLWETFRSAVKVPLELQVKLVSNFLTFVCTELNTRIRRDCWDSKVTDYGLVNRCSIPSTGIDISYQQHVQTNFGAHLAAYPISAGNKADHSLPSKAEFKNGGNFTSTPHVSSSWFKVTKLY
jgi:hypothetical protein